MTIVWTLGAIVFALAIGAGFAWGGCAMASVLLAALLGVFLACVSAPE